MSKSELPPIRVTNRRRFGVWGVVARSLVVVFLVLGVVAGGAGFFVYAHFSRDLPRLAELDRIGEAGVSRFYTADGQVAGEWYNERRLVLRWDQIPRRLILAFLAAEDAHFFEHHGLHYRGIVRAMWMNFKAGGIRSGASTITQQLAKKLVGSRRSLRRKIREAILARRIEDVLDKKDILTRYLNGIYLGYHSYGVQAAAQNYFRKDVTQLSLGEMAMLAGLPVAPSKKNPVVNMAEALRRMNYVLGQMARWGWATEEEVTVAKREGVSLKPKVDTLGDSVPYYTEAVRLRIRDLYGSKEQPDAWLARGLTVEMHVEPSFQHVGREAVARALERIAKKQGYPGRLGRLDRKTFLKRNERWLMNRPPEPKDRLLARVTSVNQTQVNVEIGEGRRGSFLLIDTRWAGPYREYKKTSTGKYIRRKVSYRPRLRRFTKAFQVGDVVLVEIQGGSADALRCKLVPIPLMEGAVVSYAPLLQGVETAVGGWDFDRSQVNRVIASRQTGSIIKPIIYAKAYDLGLAPSAIFSGVTFREGNYNPTGKKSNDDMLVWDALVRSDNAVSLRVLKYVLSRTSKEDYEKWGTVLGLSQALKGNTAEALGGDQTPLSMARAMGPFALKGYPADVHLIRKVSDAQGRVLQRHSTPLDPNITAADTFLSMWDAVLSPPDNVIDPSTAYLIAANMKDVVSRGTGKRARKLGRDVAGKTGTLPFDVWFVGFTAQRVALIWFGADRRERPLGKSEKDNKFYGSNTALPAWLDYMKQIDPHRPGGDLLGKTPAEVTHFRIDPTNGLLLEKGGRIVPHRKGTEPDVFSEGDKSAGNIQEHEDDF